MNKVELLEQLIKLQGSDDYEDAHITADGLLLAYINDPDVTKEYDQVHKWYS